MADLVGESLGAYTITERIGRGGMADVYKALHTALSVHRAVKVIRAEFVTADDFRARFQKEAQAVAQLRHPNIVQVHDFGTHSGAYYMVMEFIEGRDLKRILAAEGPIRPIRRAVEIVVRIANALEYAHGRGLIHRDIKPENVMVTASGEPILTDFGIAKLVTSNTQLTQTGFGIGTPSYMAPEQAQGLGDVGPPADIYALTVVLFELLTGRVPFSADTPIAVVMKSISDPLPLPRSLRPDISEALQAVVIKGTQKRPEERYATVGEFRNALVEAVADEADPNATEPTFVRSTAPTLAAPSRPRSNARTVGAFATIAVAAALGYYFTRGTDAVDAPAPAVTVSPAPTTPDRAAATPERAPERMEGTPGEGAGPDQTIAADRSPTLSAIKLPVEPAAERSVERTIKQSEPHKTVAPVVRDTHDTASLTNTTPAIAPEQAPERVAGTPAPEPVDTAPILTGQVSTETSAANQVTRGVTTQRDLLRMFGGPNITTYNPAGLETWVYERTVTQTDSGSSSQSAGVSTDFKAFFNVPQVIASASNEQARLAAGSRSTIRSVTVIVTFASDRTVSDYEVKESFF